MKIRLSERFFNRANMRGDNLSAIMRQGNVSYPTLLGYVNAPGGKGSVDLDTLAEVIFNVFGVAPAELSEMKFGDIFDVFQVQP